MEKLQNETNINITNTININITNIISNIINNTIIKSRELSTSKYTTSVGEGGRFLKKMTKFCLFKLVKILLILQNLMVLDGGWWSRTIRRPTVETSDAIASNKCSTLFQIYY